MIDRLLSKKFVLAMLFGLVACYAFIFTDRLTGAEFVTLTLGIVGAFNLADVASKRIEQSKTEGE